MIVALVYAFYVFNSTGYEKCNWKSIRSRHWNKSNTVYFLFMIKNHRIRVQQQNNNKNASLRECVTCEISLS